MRGLWWGAWASRPNPFLSLPGCRRRQSRRLPQLRPALHARSHLPRRPSFRAHSGPLESSELLPSLGLLEAPPPPNCWFGFDRCSRPTLARSRRKPVSCGPGVPVALLCAQEGATKRHRHHHSRFLLDLRACLLHVAPALRADISG